MNHNLLETINLLKKNKKYFPSNDDYLKILTNLYNEISQKNSSNIITLDLDIITLNLDEFDNIKLESFTEEEKNKLFDDICESFSFESMLKLKNINKLSIISPLFELMFVENELIEFDSNKKYLIQTEPILDKYNKYNIVSYIKVLLHMCNITIRYKNKILIFMIICDELFKNFQFVIDHKQFSITVKNKLIEFKKHKQDKFDIICETYNLEKNILDKWYEVMENINYK